MSYEGNFTGFRGSKQFASGPLTEVAVRAKELSDEDPEIQLLVINDRTSHVVEVVTEKTSGKPVRGRPKLGVVSKEITLLPRQWEWLGKQRGGASATIRRLVDVAVKETASDMAIREVRDVTYGFLTIMAGDLPHYEEALRELYAGNETDFKERIKEWPEDILAHIEKISKGAF